MYKLFRWICCIVAFFHGMVFSCVTAAEPAVYSYWAGWSNAAIPQFRMDGLFIAFALMKADHKGNYYTDYTVSGNFQKPSINGPYAAWNQWVHLFWNEGARAYVSYGGATNDEWRGQIIHATEAQLAKMAGEIKANVKNYYFDGVDLDIEHWWDYDAEDNLTFARQLASLVKILRHSLDNDPMTQGKAIFITVGWPAAGPVAGVPDYGSTYTGSMVPFFIDTEAMQAVAGINIMSYNTGIEQFYARLDLIDHLLAAFANSGIPPHKLILGIQPYESSGFAATSLDTIAALSHYILHNNYGGLFLWGIGTEGLGRLSAWDYLQTMQNSLK